MHTTLITAFELADHVTEQRWAVVDCRHDLLNADAGRVGYVIGHIPQAQFAHLDLALSGPTVGPDGQFRGRHPLPERTVLLETLRNLGISSDSQVVAYDAHGGMYAARLCWLLRWVGHANVAVLDGGMAAWLAQGQPLSDEVPARRVGNLADGTPLVASVKARDRQSTGQSSWLFVERRSAEPQV